MAQPAHPAAIHHLPPFVTPPGDTDVLFVVTSLVVLLMVLSIGILYFKLHALPEHMAHRGQKVQFEIVAVLGLISLFTHNHAFWIAGLLLALVPLPDFTTPLASIANSLDRIAGGTGNAVPVPLPLPPPPPAKHAPAPRASAPEAPHPAEARPPETAKV